VKARETVERKRDSNKSFFIATDGAATGEKVEREREREQIRSFACMRNLEDAEESKIWRV